MACIWYGVQSWIGGECVTLMIRSIWTSYNDVPNGIPSSGPNTRDFVSFFLFWLGSLPAIWFPVHQIRYAFHISTLDVFPTSSQPPLTFCRHLFTVKAYFVPAAAIAYFAWAVSRAGGVGPIVHQPGKLHGSDLAWGVISGIMSSIANFATLIVNDPDFARFAKTPRSALWSQLFTIPCGFAITSFIGIIVSSSSDVIFHDGFIWNPLSLLGRFLDGASSGERFGVFIIAAAFTLAQLGTNIAANSVSAGTDMTALLPRFLNIRRGGYICALVGLVMCPWHLLSTSNNFTTYLSAYSVFLSSIAGVIICDYYIVRKGYYELKSLYSAQSTSPYFYWFGWSWRGYTAYICGILINIVGFADAIGAKVPMGAVYIYRVNFFAGLIVAAVTYWLLCRLFPIPATSDVWCEMPEAADRRFSVVYEGETIEGQRGGSEEDANSSFDVEKGVVPKERKLAENF